MIYCKPFGTFEGKTVYEYTLTNNNGMSAGILSYGAIIHCLNVPDKKGAVCDVVCGYDDLSSYIEGDGYQGSVVGRFANRIAGATFELNGVTYNLYKNDNDNTLHGGNKGLNTKVYTVKEDAQNNALVMSTVMEDMEEGYPGRVELTVTYTLTEDNALAIRYQAKTDKDTIINITNHAYFNLSGFASGSVLGHLLQLDADTYLPTNESLIPTGELRSVENTPFDFRTAKPIGKDFYADCTDLTLAGGYDHCLNFVGGETKEPTLRGTLTDPASGRTMSVITNQPCVQLYSGNFMKNPDYPFKGGFPQHTQNALCLETQHMPDAIHHPNFTSVVLKPDEEYDYTTVYAFGNLD